MIEILFVLISIITMVLLYLLGKANRKKYNIIHNIKTVTKKAIKNNLNKNDNNNINKKINKKYFIINFLFTVFLIAFIIYIPTIFWGLYWNDLLQLINLAYYNGAVSDAHFSSSFYLQLDLSIIADIKAYIINKIAIIIGALFAYILTWLIINKIIK